MIFNLKLTERHTGCSKCNYFGCVEYHKKYPNLGHWLWVLTFSYRQFKTKLRKFINSLTDFDYSQIDNIEVDSIDFADAPDFADAYISYAEYKGIPMSESQLDRLNSNRDFVYEQVINKIY